MKLRYLAALLLTATAAMAQLGPLTSPPSGPPKKPYVGLLFYDGSNNLQYVCAAFQIQPVQTVYSLAAGTLTSLVVTGNTTGTLNITGQKLYVGARLVITGSATSTLNGTFSVTSVTTNTLVITVPSTANATYTDMTVTTVNPLTSAPVWSIQIFTNPSNLLGSYYFALPSGLPGNNADTPLTAICDNRATY